MLLCMLFFFGLPLLLWSYFYLGELKRVRERG